MMLVHLLAVAAALHVKPADEARVKALMAQFAARDFAAIAASLSPAAGKELTPSMLAPGWDKLRAGAGDFRGVKSVRDDAGALAVVAEFSQGEPGSPPGGGMTLREFNLVFDEAGRLIKLGRHDAWAPPAYVDGARFSERVVAVGPHHLRGYLLVPRDAKRFPGVVLLAGSGPADADESAGPIRPFRDLAEGLASRGVAVLRFEKRTHHGAEVRTVRDEYSEDADAAVALLAATPGVERVVLAGHSEGGMMAPRIALANRKIKGVALLAAPSWPFPKILVEQLLYQQKLGVPNLEVPLANARAAAKQIEDPKLKPDDVVQFGAGIPGAYFLDLRGYSAVESASRLTVPLFIAWGDRDLKVIPADFDGWRPLAEKPGVTLKTYPGVQHLLTPLGDAQAHVAAALIEDLARWLGR